MSWKTSSPVDQRVLFIAALESEPAEVFSALCARFEISRKTGYKWVERYNAGGPAMLMDRVSRPRVLPHATPPLLVASILALRKAHPRWGPKKLAAVLRAQDDSQPWPAPSTIGDLLKRHGLIVPRRRRVRWTTRQADRPIPEGPNDTWCVDFKGDFLLGDQTRCYPLTQSDAVRAEFERLFELYGLPSRIRSDNGVPFSTTAPGGLSPLSIWWIKLGIILERTDPGHPEQNGAHERMHRTLKDETTRPPEHSMALQQVRSDLFRREYNELRPHESLKQTTPASHYTSSLRTMPALASDPTYPETFKRLRVSPVGQVELTGKRIWIHAMLKRELIGLQPLAPGHWAVFFGTVALGVIDLSAPKPRLRPADAKKVAG
jgi:putative transposase